jgi:hypothetical protein
MKDIPINNPDVLKALNNFLWYYENKDIVARNLKLHGEAKDRKYFMSEKYRDEIIAQDTAHEGFPDAGHSYALKADRLHHIEGRESNPEAAGFVTRYSEYNTELCSLLSTRNNALTQMYPPDGFISWHNNANASAYNIIFSWSETGDGVFRYVDGHTGKEVVMQDKKGWQCKAGYFGAYHEPWYKRVYHAAETDCWRITVSYIFDRSDMSLGLQDDVIEEIMSEF